MDVTALCPNCDEAVMVVDPDEGDDVDCPECAMELVVASVDLESDPPNMVLEEVDPFDADEEDEDQEDEDEDDDEEDDEFDDDTDDDDETEV